MDRYHSNIGLEIKRNWKGWGRYRHAWRLRFDQFAQWTGAFFRAIAGFDHIPNAQRRTTSRISAQSKTPNQIFKNAFIIQLKLFWMF